MNVDFRIRLIKRHIEDNLAAMSNPSLSNSRFCELADDNIIKIRELDSLYKVKNELIKTISQGGLCMKAEEVFDLIKNLDNGERWKLLDMLYDEYYNTTGIKYIEVEFDDD